MSAIAIRLPESGRTGFHHKRTFGSIAADTSSAVSLPNPQKTVPLGASICSDTQAIPAPRMATPSWMPIGQARGHQVAPKSRLGSLQRKAAVPKRGGSRGPSPNRGPDRPTMLA